MTSHSSDRPVSALRARMIEDMMVRGFTEATRTDYVRRECPIVCVRRAVSHRFEPSAR